MSELIYAHFSTAILRIWLTTSFPGVRSVIYIMIEILTLALRPVPE